MTVMHRLREVGKVISAKNIGKISQAQDHLNQASGHLEDVVKSVGASESDTGAGVPDGRDMMMGEAERSYQQLIDMIGDAANDHFGSTDPMNYCSVCIQDVYNDYAIVRVDNDLFSVPWAVQADGVTLGDPTPVTVTYTASGEMTGDGDHDADDGQMAAPGVPGQESVRLSITNATPLLERQFTQAERDAMAKSGEAMPDGGYPIATKGDLANAIQSIGRGNGTAAIKAHITKRAKALDATDSLPADWDGSTKTTESASVTLTSDVVPLVEAAIKDDGTAQLKIIQPGWGSSGYYPPDVLERDGPRAFPRGTHMYLDHPTESEAKERPERSLKDLAATLTEDAHWIDRGPDGPGLYARAQVRDDYRDLVNQLAPFTGVSIRASGTARDGKMDGKGGKIVEAIFEAGTSPNSVDFVTRPGAGGHVLDLFEAAGRGSAPSSEGIPQMDTELREAQARIQRLEEQLTLQSATNQVGAALARVANLPELTKKRLLQSLVIGAPTKDGKLDSVTFAESIQTAITEAIAEFAEVTGAGRVHGLGSTDLFSESGIKPEEIEGKMSDVFGRLMGNTDLGKLAGSGRR